MTSRPELTKGQRRELRRLASLAYERELAAALTALGEQFRRWQAGETGSHDLNQAIHAFHQGPSRQLWSRYNDSPTEFAIALAVRSGIVAEHELGAEFLEILRPYLHRDLEDTERRPGSHGVHRT